MATVATRRVPVYTCSCNTKNTFQHGYCLSTFDDADVPNGSTCTDVAHVLGSGTVFCAVGGVVRGTVDTALCWVPEGRAWPEGCGPVPRDLWLSLVRALETCNIAAFDAAMVDLKEGSVGRPCVTMYGWARLIELMLVRSLHHAYQPNTLPGYGQTPRSEASSGCLRMALHLYQTCVDVEAVSEIYRNISATRFDTKLFDARLAGAIQNDSNFARSGTDMTPALAELVRSLYARPNRSYETLDINVEGPPCNYLVAVRTSRQWIAEGQARRSGRHTKSAAPRVSAP